MKKLLMAVAALMCAGSVALAGPNAGGTLIVHANPGLNYTTDITNYCGMSGLTACQGAVTTVDGSRQAVWHVLAAFPPGSNPRMAGLVFGVTYTPGVVLLGQGACADFELPDGNWPASGSGTALTWTPAETGLLTEVYWFAGYNYYGGCEIFQLGPHPTQGASFADDSVPSVLDAIAGFGRLGFNCPGGNICPDVPPPPTGACCFPDFSCQILTADECALGGGNYLGDDTTCDMCPPPPATGACCVGEVCSVVTAAECDQMGGSYQGDGTDCDPDPCVVIPTESTSWGQIKANYR
jgi:hypothetical protein